MTGRAICRQSAEGGNWIVLNSWAMEQAEREESGDETCGVDASYGVSDGWVPHSYTDTNCKNGREYRYKIIVAYADGSYQVSNVKRGMWLKPVTLKSCKSTKRGTISLSWSKNAQADGYQVEYSYTNRTGTCMTMITAEQKIKGTEQIRMVRKGFVPGRTYRVRVRAYKIVNGKTYTSTRSAKGKVTVKK